MPEKKAPKVKAKKKSPKKPVAPATETAAADVGPSELERAQARQRELLDLGDRMAKEGVDSKSKLDVLLSQVNQRVKELGG